MTDTQLCQYEGAAFDARSFLRFLTCVKGIIPIKYVITVIGVAFVLLSIIINFLTDQQPKELYYTVQSLLISITGYSIFVILSKIFSTIETKKTITILNFVIGSGHLILYIFMFICFVTIYFSYFVGYINNIKIDLHLWENLDKTIAHFLTSCAVEQFFLLNFLFAGNQLLLIKSPFQYLFFINFIAFFIYMLIASYIMHCTFGESKWKFFTIGTSAYLLTFALWNAANLYGLYYVQHQTACGEIAMRQAKAHTAESMLKTYYQKEYETEVSYLKIERITVKGTHISRVFRIKDEINQIDKIAAKLREWKSNFQVNICEKDFYSNFRELGVSVTEIYNLNGKEFYKFTVTAADCP